MAEILSGNAPRAESSPRLPPVWVVGLSMAPFGLVAGFTITALPFLLTRQGVSLDRVAGVSAAVMSPTFWGFLLQPLMDTGLTRRIYCWLTAVIAGLCLFAALPLLSPAHLGLATLLLLVAELAMVLFSGAASGWIAEFTPDSLRGAVSGWTNVANLGGGALGSLVVMSLAGDVRQQWLGLGLGVAAVLGAVPTLFFPEPGSAAFRFRQIFTTALRTVWNSARTKECLTGFALFLAPASAAAAINLFSGMGPDFHVNATVVIWVTGAGCAASASAGALLGGYAADRLPRGILYLGGGVAASATALVMAFLPHVAWVFIAGALTYNFMAGGIYAAFNALGFQLVGRKTAVASTQLGLFAAATNGAIVYMTRFDGHGYRVWGIRGLLLTDGLAGMTAAVILLLLLGRRLMRMRGHEEPAVARAQ